MHSRRQEMDESRSYRVRKNWNKSEKNRGELLKHPASSFLTLDCSSLSIESVMRALCCLLWLSYVTLAACCIRLYYYSYGFYTTILYRIFVACCCAMVIMCRVINMNLTATHITRLWTLHNCNTKIPTLIMPTKYFAEVRIKLRHPEASHMTIERLHFT